MKRLTSCGVAVVLLLCILGGTVSAAARGCEAVYTFSQDGEGYLMAREAGELTFWEAPNVLTGQTVSGGVITLKNAADRAADFTLTSVELPYGDDTALTYLDAVTLVIRQGDQEVYHGPFTRIMDADRAPIVFTDVQPGESRELTLSVSCDFTYSGAVPSYESIVWTFETSVRPITTQPNAPSMQQPPTTDWTMIAKIAGTALGVLVLTCVTIAVVRMIRKKVDKKKQ